MPMHHHFPCLMLTSLLLPCNRYIYIFSFMSSSLINSCTLYFILLHFQQLHLTLQLTAFPVSLCNHKSSFSTSSYDTAARFLSFMLQPYFEAFPAFLFNAPAAARVNIAVLSSAFLLFSLFFSSLFLSTSWRAALSLPFLC